MRNFANFVKNLQKKIATWPKKIATWFKGLSRPIQISSLSALVIVTFGGTALGLVLAGRSHPARAAIPRPHPTTTTAAAPAVVSTRCPLTDLPAPGGVVPKRPALLIKIGNEPGTSRPQSGLNEADIVFDTPAEGFIMRYVAVYQCGNASSIGPTRSVRWVDYHMIAREFVHPILAFAGGINPNVDSVAATPWLTGANLLEGAQDAGTRISSREPPDNLYTSTSALYSMFKSSTTPPPSVFSGFTNATMPGSKPASSVGINFSFGTDVIWKWDAKTHMWLHTYSGTPDIDALTNKQVSTRNIVIEIVHYTLGPYIESTGGSGDVESDLLGSGPGYVLRDGAVTKVTWHRSDELGPMSFTNSKGQAVEPAPGRTWVEIVPDVQADAPGGITFTR